MGSEITSIQPLFLSLSLFLSLLSFFLDWSLHFRHVEAYRLSLAATAFSHPWWLAEAL